MVIYLASQTYITCNDDQLEMKYAGDYEHWNECYDEKYFYFRSCDPEDFIQYGELMNLRLVKYKGLLTPKQMSTDLMFTTTDEDISYKKHIYVWFEEGLVELNRRGII